MTAEDRLDANKTDHTMVVARSLAGAIPIAGSLVGEIVTTFIPNQRTDRIVDYLRILHDRVSECEQVIDEQRSRSPEFVDLVEESMHQAAKTDSEERHRKLAEIVKNGLTDEELESAHHRRMLDLLGQVSEIEVLLLQMYSENEQGNRTFAETHQDILLGPRLGITRNASLDDIAANAVHNSYKPRLASLGLLKPSFRRPRRDELPEFDPATGMMKASGYDLTHLGRLVLRSIGCSTILDGIT